MLALDQLKDMVVSNMENTGFLDNMRANLKSNVYKIIEKQGSNSQKDKAGFQWEHPQVEKLHSMKDGMIGIQLIGEFLEHFKIDYTLSVYKKELRAHDFNRDDLIENLNIKHHPSHNTPILLHIIQEYIRINDLNYSGIHNNNNNNLDNSYSKKQTFADGFYKKNSNSSSDQMESNNKNENFSSNNNDSSNKNISKGKSKEQLADELEKQRRLQEWQEEQDRIQQEEEEKLEAQRLENERRERIEREFQEKQEQERQEEEEKAKQKQEKEEKRKKEMELAKAKKKLPATAVNKIRGGKGQEESALASIYGMAITGQPQQNYDPYGGGADPNDPYAFDVAQGQGGYGDEQDPYGYDMDGGQQNKFSSQGPYGADPYANIDMDADIGGDKDKEDQQEGDYYLDEDIDYYGESMNSQNQYKDKDRKNPMFTSSEDYYGASQSQGLDQSVNSDAIEQYDYHEQIKKKY